jgi:hypothetical protein
LFNRGPIFPLPARRHDAVNVAPKKETNVRAILRVLAFEKKFGALQDRQSHQKQTRPPWRPRRIDF